MPVDYDGDGKTDITVYRPATGTWWVLLSSTNFATYAGYQWGVSTDVPVVGDYDGDGKADLAVYRPATGSWYMLLSSTNFATYVSSSRVTDEIALQLARYASSNTRMRFDHFSAELEHGYC